MNDPKLAAALHGLPEADVERILNRPDRDRGDRGGDRPRNWSSDAKPQGRDNRAPDPNSPFAKLLALKEQMQNGRPDKK